MQPTMRPERGYRLLTETPLLTSDFSQQVFDEVWRSWPRSLRSEAEKASPEERRRMAFERYGLTHARPMIDIGKPLQYVVDDDRQLDDELFCLSRRQRVRRADARSSQQSVCACKR